MIPKIASRSYHVTVHMRLFSRNMYYCVSTSLFEYPHFARRDAYNKFTFNMNIFPEEVKLL